MSSRYWIGGTGAWNDTAHWSLASGGTGGASAPQWTDDVFIDAQSGFGSGGTITLASWGAEVHDFTSTTGASYTIAQGGDRYRELDIYGSAVFESGLTLELNLLYFGSADVGETIAQNGALINALRVTFKGTGEWTLLSDFSVYRPDPNNSYFTVKKGTLNTGAYNVTAGNLFIGDDIGSDPVTVNMGSGVWTSIIGKWRVQSWVTLDTGTSKIVMIEKGDAWFDGRTYYDFETANGQTLWGGGTFRNFTIYAPALNNTDSNEFESGKTFTITGSFTTNASANHLCDMKSKTGGVSFTLSKSSGTVICDYLILIDSAASGGAAWYAGSHSQNVSGNSGWVFADPGGGSMDGLSKPAHGGGAQPISVDTSGKISGGPAMPAYVFASEAAAIAAGYVCEAGPAMSVALITAAQIASGEWKRDADPFAVVCYIAPVNMPVEGGYAVPIVQVN
jgi:hypothetical protein